MLCKECRYFRERARRFSMYHRYIYKEPLGTTDFSSHRKEDFQHEKCDINDEFRLLGLRRTKIFKYNK